MLSDLHADLLDIVISNLDKWDASQLLITNKYLSKIAARAINQGKCLGRIVVASSKNRKLVEIDPKSGDVVRWVRTAPNHRQDSCFRSPNKTPQWITSLKFCPYNDDLYVCEYAISGVAIYCGWSLQYKRTFFSHSCTEHPEGLAFADNHCFVASAANEWVVKLSMDGRFVAISCLPGGVPWSLASVPSSEGGGHWLLVSVDNGYEARNYANAPDKKSGAILLLRHDHTFGRREPDEWQILVAGLSRPSGIFCHTSPALGRPASHTLYATTMHSPLLESQPFLDDELPARKGALEMRPLCMKARPEDRDEGLSPGDKQWDVCRVGSALYATIHTGGSPHRSRLHQYDLKGRLVRVIRSPHFHEANMLAVQQ